MTDEIPDAPPVAEPAPKTSRRQLAEPVLEQLFEHHPALFGARFLPLKRGIFQDLMEAHPGVFDKTALKAALGVHTRSTRYLAAVASGLPRHDLQAQVVEPVSADHRYQAVVELFARRAHRNADEAAQHLLRHLQHAYADSGLNRSDYLALVGTPDATVAPVLDQALDAVDQGRARQAALKQAFEASGQSIQAFALAVGVPVGEVRAAVAGTGAQAPKTPRP